MRVLVACEFSGVVREAFVLRGHDAYSCDIVPTEIPGQHIQDDVSSVLFDNWDMMIAHPPCTYLCGSGARWWAKKKEQCDALAFVRLLLDAPIQYIALENPVGCISTRIRKADQYVQPWEFGHGETKKTGLWLKGLPVLRPTNVVDGRVQRCWNMAPSAHRAKERSRTYPGIAQAMAEQWG